MAGNFPKLMKHLKPQFQQWTRAPSRIHTTNIQTNKQTKTFYTQTYHIQIQKPKDKEKIFKTDRGEKNIRRLWSNKNKNYTEFRVRKYASKMSVK